ANSCFNDCIGNDQFSPFQSGFFNTGGGFFSFVNNPYFSPQQPCGMFTKFLYLNKQKRFPDISDLSQDADQAAYSLYQQTGLCPVAMNFQFLLNEIATTGNLTNNLSDLGQLNTYAGLVFALNG